MSLSVTVFSPDILPIGTIDVITGLIWTEKFANAGSFELWCPRTDKNVELLQEDNLVWIGKDSAGVIEYKYSSVDSNGNETLNIKGRLAESYLDYRTVYPRLSFTGKASEVIQKLVYNNLIEPSDTARKIERIELDMDQSPVGDQVSYQNIGSSVLAESSRLCEANSLGFNMKLFPKLRLFKFKVYQSVDRTIQQEAVDPVLISSDFDDILNSEYYHNKSDFRNLAIVAGEGEGAARTIEVVGSETGIQRREIYVDARDLQSETYDDEGSAASVIPASEYKAMLKERGEAKLQDYKDIESVFLEVRTFGNVGYKFGVDYFLGDRVTVYDARQKLRVNAYVTQATWTYDQDGERLDLSFGYQQPTIAEKLRRS